MKANTPLLRSFKKIDINESGAYTPSSNIDISLNIDGNEVEVPLPAQRLVFPLMFAYLFL